MRLGLLLQRRPHPLWRLLGGGLMLLMLLVLQLQLLCNLLRAKQQTQPPNACTGRGREVLVAHVRRLDEHLPLPLRLEHCARERRRAHRNLERAVRVHILLARGVLVLRPRERWEVRRRAVWCARGQLAQVGFAVRARVLCQMRAALLRRHLGDLRTRPTPLVALALAPALVLPLLVLVVLLLLLLLLRTHFFPLQILPIRAHTDPIPINTIAHAILIVAPLPVLLVTRR
ncbi:hypothetical protein C8J57DRAFT_1291068 [Mycena rebaudengoi]|nr:hypothetical protein C8J57DRAFT_1291068 [Mycena rebaudengoi]